MCPFLFLLFLFCITTVPLRQITHILLQVYPEIFIWHTCYNTVLIHNYLVYQVKLIIIPGSFYLLLLVMFIIRQGLRGKYSSGSLGKALVKVPIIVTCAHFMVYQRGMCQVIFGNKMLRLLGRDKSISVEWDDDFF